MAEAIAPNIPTQAVIPPDRLVETITPAPPGPNAVATVTLDYPKRFVEITNDISQAATNPESRMRLASNITAQDVEAKNYNPNEQPQWGKVVASLLSRNYGEALKWYNGGGVVEESAKDVNGNSFFKEMNERGFTGRIRDSSGSLLNPQQMKDLTARGGVLTKNDNTALSTTNWVNAKYSSELASKGLTNAVNLATNDAFNAARTASGANQNIDEQLQLAGSLRPVLDYISTLPQERRKNLLGNINRLVQVNDQSNRSKETGLNVNSSGQQTVGANISGNVGGAGGLDQSAPPTRGRLGGSIGANTSAATQAGASGREASIAGSSNANMLQEQQNLQAAIMQEMQEVIKSPAQFQEFMRLQSLNAANDLAYKNIPDHVKPPTWNTVPDTDPFTGGAQAMIANRVNQQRNNALMAAWSRDLFTKTRESASSGKQVDLDKIAQDFQKSDIFKAINNTYEFKMKSQMEGRVIRPPKGTLMVNNRNQIGTSPGE